MVIVDTISHMQNYSSRLRDEGKRICLVPTMGALHEGHLSLVSRGKECGDICVVSIFVNPIQFAPNEDYMRYPRPLQEDLKWLESLGVDIAFTPSTQEMYPQGFETYVEVTQLQKHLCGPFRPGHFRGVATVVLKLFNIVKPHIAMFGEKDYQQLKIIRKMVRDLALEVDIIGCPTVREESGLALSSRNGYLSARDREKAMGIPRALDRIKKEFERGVSDTETLIARGWEVLKEHGLTDVDYLSICDSDTLEKKEHAERGDLVAIALRVGAARLIDNLTL